MTAQSASAQSIRGQVLSALDETRVCEYCDAGDPTSLEPYHKPEDCPSRPKDPALIELEKQFNNRHED